MSCWQNAFRAPSCSWGEKRDDLFFPRQIGMPSSPKPLSPRKRRLLISDDDASEKDSCPAKVPRTSAAETYFARSIRALSKISRRPFDSLAYVVRPSSSILSSVDKSIKNGHRAELTSLYHLHRRKFPQWRFELDHGFNLLFYGAGSKKTVLNDFQENYLQDFPCLVIKGDSETLTLNAILDGITQILQKQTTGRSYLKRTENILSMLSCSSKVPRIALIIHNIDGEVLTTDTCQTVLTTLAKHEKICIIATSDHVNIGMLWSNADLAKFNWVFHDVTTLADYNGDLVKRGRGKENMATVDSAEKVLKSLTSNAHAVFKVLVEHHLECFKGLSLTTPGATKEGLRYDIYFERCRNKFAVSNDATFRMQLVEFRDHGLIESRRMVDGSEVFYIPMTEQDILRIHSLLL